MTLYREMGAATLEAQYNNRARRGASYDSLAARWLARSAAHRVASSAKVDLAYGSGTREKLDFFFGGDANGPLLVYIHGGYWQRGDKSMYSFISEALTRHGVSVALLNHDLAPAVRVGQIPPQLRNGVAWLWHHAGDLGFSRERLFMSGHSAGGHLTAMMMAAHWPAVDACLPVDLLRGAMPVSGLYALEPLVHTSINVPLRMTIAEAMAESPLLLPLASHAPQLVVAGGAETSELRRQSAAYVEEFATPDRPMTHHETPGDDHFDVLERLADDGSVWFGKAMKLLSG